MSILFYVYGGKSQLFPKTICLLNRLIKLQPKETEAGIQNDPSLVS